MYVLQRTVVFFTVILVDYGMIVLSSDVQELEAVQYKDILKVYNENENSKFVDFVLTLLSLPGHFVDTRNLWSTELEDDKENSKVRSKREESRSNKYRNAATMSQLRVLRIQLQMLRNLVSKENVGGAHPMSSSVPKPFLTLLRNRLVEFLFPGSVKKRY